MDIKPHYDDDGVPWCDAECPQGESDLNMSKEVRCQLDGWWRTVVKQHAPGDGPCPHAVKRMAQWNKIMRRFILGWWPGYEDAIHWDDEIDRNDYPWMVAAQESEDALMAEKEGE